jgi:hypothetical protein
MYNPDVSMGNIKREREKKGGMRIHTSKPGEM